MSRALDNAPINSDSAISRDPAINPEVSRLQGAMCDLHDSHGLLPPLEADEYRIDTARVRGFIGEVRDRIARAGSPADACELISPLFADLLADRDWLPADYQEP